ncbi:methyltransferase domain-containing protein [Myxococcota bacterium]|nr:methyltransferase domain-containing protein [Myxococcota bacterium]
MASRIRHHVNPLSMRMLEFDPEPLALSERPIHVELGCAEGEFLFRFAAAHPDYQVIGVEIRKDLVHDIRKTAQQQKVSDRVQAVFANIPIHLDLLFPPNSVTRFYLNFPDPYFKREQHKRRVLTPEVVRSVHAALIPGGELFFQSDVFDTALDAMYITELHAPAGFESVGEPWTFLRDNPYADSPTRRERFCTEEGIRIWRFCYRKSA